MRKTELLVLVTLIVSGLGAIGCNLTGGIDDPKTRDELIAEAQAKMDTADCEGAVVILDGLSNKDNRSLQMLGTAHLCRAGATVNKVEGTLAGFDTASGNFTVVGSLANRLLPITADFDAKILAAVTAFGNMTQTDEKAIWLAYANIIRAAGFLATASSDRAVVRRSDISPGDVCRGAVCTGGGAAVCLNANLTDANANALINALVAASTAAGTASSIGAAKDLATRLGASAAQTAAGGRCTAFNNLLAQ